MKKEPATKKSTKIKKVKPTPAPVVKEKPPIKKVLMIICGSLPDCVRQRIPVGTVM